MLRAVRHYDVPHFRGPAQNNVVTRAEPQLELSLPIGVQVDKNRKTFVPCLSSEERRRYSIFFGRQKC
jgi:hypothetical protein